MRTFRKTHRGGVHVFFVALFLCGLLSEKKVFACGPTTFSGIDLVSGEKVDWAPREGAKGSVLVFLGATCPCSQSHERVLTSLAESFPDFSFVGVHSNVDESVELASKHFKSIGLTFPVLRDEGATLADAYGALKTPHAYVVSPTGECLFSGGVDDSKNADHADEHYLKVALLAVRQGKKPSPDRVRTLGCIIKR